MASLKRNFLFSSILTLSNYIFSFITYPYVSRVLGVTNIGACNFVDSVVTYFILFTALGVGVVGIREISACKEDKEKLSRVFSSLVAFNAITTLVGMLILFICIILVPKLWEHRYLMCIGFAKLAVNFVLVEWLYKGLENFKYITTRTLIVRVLYVVSVFVFVRNESDCLFYYTITVLTVLINAAINILYSRNFVRFSVKLVNVKYFLKPVVNMGVYMILTSLYTSFNIVFLGFVSGVTEVGYYSTATKFYAIIIAIFTSFTNVMLPRMSSLLSENNKDQFLQKVSKSFDLLFVFVFPVLIFIEINTDNVISLLSGQGYEGAILPMKIIMPLIFIIGYEQIIVLQILMPLKKDKEILRGAILGSFVGLISNIVLVKNLGATGTALVWVLSEFCVACVAQHYVYKFVKLSYPFQSLIKRIIFYLPIAFVCFRIKCIEVNVFLSFFIQFVVVFLTSLFVEYKVLDNTLVVEYYKRIKTTLKLSV